MDETQVEPRIRDLRSAADSAEHHRSLVNMILVEIPNGERAFLEQPLADSAGVRRIVRAGKSPNINTPITLFELLDRIVDCCHPFGLRLIGTTVYLRERFPAKDEKEVFDLVWPSLFIDTSHRPEKYSIPLWITGYAYEFEIYLQQEGYVEDGLAEEPSSSSHASDLLQEYLESVKVSESVLKHLEEYADTLGVLSQTIPNNYDDGLAEEEKREEYRRNDEQDRKAIDEHQRFLGE